jgi:hypothetical protein
MSEQAEAGTDAQLLEFDARLQRLETSLDMLEVLVTTGGTEPAPGARTPTAAEPAYETLEAWVTEHFAPMYARPLGGEYRWCPRWQEHAEAISRLEALWRSWETLRLDPKTGMAAWYRDYLDHQLPILLSNRGPFSRCSQDRHERMPALPVTSATLTR